MGWISSTDKCLGEPFFKPTYPYEKWGKGRPTKEALRKRELYNKEYEEYRYKSLMETSLGKLLLHNTICSLKRKRTKLQYNH